MPTSLGIETMDITFLFENGLRAAKDPTGMGREPIRQLPWAFVTMNDPADAAQYVMPLPPGVMSCGNGIYTQGLRDIKQVEPTSLVMSYGRCYMAYMENMPWPQSSTRPIRENDRTGYVHWFGGM